jgi:hypothetical protein
VKIKTEQIIEVSDWDKLVEKTYGRPYCFQQQDGCKSRGIFRFSVPDNYTYDYKNNTIPEIVNGKKMGVSFEAWLARDPKQPIAEQKYDYKLNLWWERNFYPDFQMVANDLCNKGLLKAGNYIIEIDW